MTLPCVWYVQFWALEGKPQKHIIISRDDAYHGSTVAAGALSGMPPIHAPGSRSTRRHRTSLRRHINLNTGAT